MRQTIFLALSVFTALLFGSCSTDNNGNTTVVPLAPTALTATVQSTTQVNLAWTDNATNETGYKIERKTGAASYAVVGTTGADITAFNDLGLTPNTSYTYRVYAYNSAGNSLQYSNEVTVTTQDTIPAWLTNGLVGYWPFNGNANDESGNGNNGTVNGAILTTDRNGNVNAAYSFDGLNDCIDINNSLLLDPISSSSMTISFWSKLFDASFQGAIISKYEQGSSVNSSFGLMYGSGLLWASGNGTNLFTTGIPSDTNWHHISAILNRVSGTIVYHENGALLATGNINYNSIATSVIISIGRMFDGAPGSSNSNHFQGLIDDIRIYNRALTQSEISYLASH